MDNLGQGDSNGEKWHATLRSRGASLTAMACRTPLERRGTAEGEGAR
ncbi:MULTISPECIES: DUF6380 family protein [unclassified Streptomyces]